MYEAGTILARKTAYTEPIEGVDLTPYNEVQVVGQSPVQDGIRSAEFSGQAGDKITVKPTTFGPTVDVFAGNLQTDYDILSLPPDPFAEAPADPRPRRTAPALSPEDQLAAGTAPPVKPSIPVVDSEAGRRADLEETVATLTDTVATLVEREDALVDEMERRREK